MWPSIRRRLFVLLLVWPCFGAGSAKPGTDVVGGAGGGVYFMGGICAGPSYGVKDAQFYGRASHQFQNHARLTVEVGHSQGTVGSSNPGTTGFPENNPLPPDPAMAVGAPVRATNVAVRGGAAYKYGGVELGLLGRVSQMGWSRPAIEGQPYITGEGWLGHPRVGYAWGRVFAGPSVSNSIFLPNRMPPIAVGFGHRNEYMRIDAGVGSAGFSLDGDVNVGKRVTLGAMACYGSGDDFRVSLWSALAMVGLRFDTPESKE